MGGSWALSARLLIYYPFFLRKIKASLIPEHESQRETMRKCPVCRTRCETHKGNEGKTAFCTFFSLISAGTWKHKREIFPSRMCTAGGVEGGVPLERGHLRAGTVMSPGCGVPAGLQQRSQVGLEAF